MSKNSGKIYTYKHRNDIWVQGSRKVILHPSYFYFITLINFSLYTNNYLHIDSEQKNWHEKTLYISHHSVNNTKISILSHFCMWYKKYVMSIFSYVFSRLPK
jgi:hypothetical protein